jgi:HK97 family phage major capsid protein
MSFASREVMEDSEVAIASIIASGFAKAYATAVEAAIVNGTLVTGDGITGVAPTSTTAAADAVTGDELVAHFYKMDAAYRNDSVWLMSANTISAIRSLKDANERYLLSGLEAGMPTLLGRPVLECNAMADMGAGNIFASLVDPTAVIFHEVRGFEVERSDSYRWANDVTSFKGSVRLDAAVGVEAGVANIANA